MMRQRIVVIDPGHGGSDPGTQAAGRHWESDINLDVALALGWFLQTKGIDVHYTRSRDISMRLLERVAFVERIKPHALISIHCNAVMDDPDTSRDERKFASGFEIFFRDEGDRRLAESLHRYLLHAGLNDRGIKQDIEYLGKRLTILSNSIPAVLIELGFLSNEHDAEFIQTNKIQLAELLSKGVFDFLGMIEE